MTYMTPTRFEAIIQRLPPEKRNTVRDLALSMADDIIEGCKSDRSTKDGYGTAMRLLGRLPGTYRPLILAAMAERGYPMDTLESLAVLV